MNQRTKSLSLAGFALVAALAAFSFRTLHGSEGEAPAVTLPTAVEVLLLRAGLEPEALAAAGVSGSALAAQLAASANALSPLPAQLAVADEAYAAARVERDRLVRLVESGQSEAIEDDLVALAAAREDLEQAETARAGVLDDAFEAATTQMTEARIATLTQIRANAHWHVPVKYKVAARQQRAWLTIRDCLAHVRTYARHELEPLPEHTAVLAAFDEESAVATAASNLGTNLAGVQTTWDATFVD